MNHSVPFTRILLPKFVKVIHIIKVLVDIHIYHLGFPSGSVEENPPANAGDTGDTGLAPG